MERQSFMIAYLDNSATTRPFDDVRELMRKIDDEYYGNPSSLHMAGVKAEGEVKYSKEIFASILKVNEKEIYFTSGGTESDNLALIGCARANVRSGKHLITTKVEHPAILETMKYLEQEGYSVTYLDTDATGRVSVESVVDAITDETILVSVMCVNNEIGSVMPIAQIGEAIKKKNPKILFHVDAVQGFGKLKIYPKRMKIDLLSVSGHKIHGPKGIGILYVDEHVKIHPIIFGGGQQKGLRSGTENVPAIAGIGRAAEEIYSDFDSKMDRLYRLKTYFIDRLLSFDSVTINGLTGEYTRNGCKGPDEVSEDMLSLIRESAPHVVSASFLGVRAEVLLHALEDKGVYVSAGSACASNKPSISATLKAIGVVRELLDSTVRFSFSVETGVAELDYTINCLEEILPMLRKYSRK